MKNKKKTKRQLINIFTFSFLMICLFIFIIIPITQKTFIYFSNKILKVLRPEQIVVEFDSLYSEAFKNNISEFIFSNTADKKLLDFELNHFNSEIKSEFKGIKNIEWNFYQPGLARVKLCGATPFCKLNDKFIVTDDKSLLELNWFEDCSISCSKDLYMPLDVVDKNMPPKAFSYLQTIPEYIWGNYFLNYLKRNKIVLHSKNKKEINKNFFVIVQEKMFNEKKFFWAKNIAKNFIKGPTNRRYRRKEYLLDLRFKDRILLKEFNFKNMERGLWE